MRIRNVYFFVKNYVKVRIGRTYGAVCRLELTCDMPCRIVSLQPLALVSFFPLSLSPASLRQNSHSHSRNSLSIYPGQGHCAQLRIIYIHTTHRNLFTQDSISSLSLSMRAFAFIIARIKDFNLNCALAVYMQQQQQQH